MVDIPALRAGGVLGAAETPARMVVSPLPQPFPQRRVGVGRRLAAWPVTLGAAVLSDDPTGEPLADIHHRDEVMHGCPPVLRA